MYQYRTGLGQVWVGTKLPPSPSTNIIWLKPSDDKRVLWEIRTFNIYKEEWEVLTSAALTAEGLLKLIYSLEKKVDSLEELKVVLYDQVQSLTEDVNEINQILFTQYISLTMSRTPTLFEKGVSTQVTLNWSTKFNNQEIEPDSISVKKGSQVLTSDKTLKTIKDSISDTQVYSMTAVIKGITKTASVTVSAYYPMYFGASIKDSLVSSDILSLTKQPIKASPSGNVTIEVEDNEYIWLCVPSNMTINSVKSGGFDVPMAAPITVVVNGKGNYKCYRSANKFVAGTFVGVIA
jgi:hypothetical protein